LVTTNDLQHLQEHESKIHRNISLIFRYSGFSTEGETERVLFVGPMLPATYRFTPLNTKTTISKCFISAPTKHRYNRYSKQSLPLGFTLLQVS